MEPQAKQAKIDSPEAEGEANSMEIGTEQESTELISEEQDNKKPRLRKNALAATEIGPGAKSKFTAEVPIDSTKAMDIDSGHGSLEEEATHSSTMLDAEEKSILAPLRKISSTESEVGLACPKCYEPFVDTRTPQKLPVCNHVICIECLNKMTRFGADSKISCPQCRRTSSIPNGGTAAMETNRWLQELAQLYHMGKLRNRMDEIAEDLAGMKLIMDKNLEELKTYKKETQDSLKKDEDHVDRCVQAAQAEAWVLKGKIREIGEKRLTHIRKDVKHLESRVDNVSSVYEMLTNTDENTAEIHYDHLANKLEDLVNTPITPERMDMNTQVTRFLPEKVSLGRVIRIRNLELVSGFKDNFVRIKDITVTPDGQLVVCDTGPNAVTVYIESSNNNKSYPIYKRKLRLSLNKRNPNRPTGVAALPDGKFLVARQVGIEVYDTMGNYEKTYKTINTKLKPSDIYPCIYSVTILEGDKIVAGDITRNVITIHNLAGDILTTLATPIKPWCLAPAKEKQFVTITDWRRNKLCIQHISSGAVTLTLDMPEPLGVCYDKGSDSFLVGRGDRNASNMEKTPSRAVGVVEQHNSTGDRNFIMCLAQRMQCPTAMVFTSDDMLAVADFTGVKLYRVT